MSAPEPARFVWPPRPPSPPRQPEASTPAPESEVEAKPADHRERAHHAIERVWFAPTRLPLARRAADLGWAPEPLEAACARCGQSVGPHEEDEFGCAACAGKRPAWSRFVRLAPYAEPVDEWVQEVKFERSWRLGEALGRLLGERLAGAGFEGVIVPMPTTWRRRMARGTDHALTLARGVRAATGCPIVRALGRDHRPSQRSVTMARRRWNVSGSFHARPRACRRIAGRAVVVVDDVATSGATLRAGCRALRAELREACGGRAPSVWVAVVAVTPPASGAGSGGVVGPRSSTALS